MSLFSILSAPVEKVARRLLSAALLLLLLSPVYLAWTRASSDNPDEKVKKQFYSAKDRLAAMKAAALFEPKAVSEANTLEGPKQKKNEFQFHAGDKVICDFKTAGKDMGGKTPKFGCQITSVVSADGTVQTLTPDMDDSDPIKVKFGANDNEVYAEIVATRLMWAMGYYADSWFSVKVECHNCPENPVSGSGNKETRTYYPATIVRKFSGHKMTEAGKPEQGWSWKELDADNGQPVYQRDGLKLLCAFMKHSDNKPPQQRLSCDKVNIDQSTNPFTATCEKPVMLVQDVGATFGGGGWFTSNDSAKINLDVWSHKSLWNRAGTEAEPKQCQATLRKSLTAHDGLSNPEISEDGRRFDAGLMCQLSDKQIEDLFRAAHVADMPKYHNTDGSFKSGMDEPTILKQWVAAFKTKREDLAKARCLWKDKPADLKVIDNPAGLSSVPNYCTTKPN